jgi:hypothetical protein
MHCLLAAGLAAPVEQMAPPPLNSSIEAGAQPPQLLSATGGSWLNASAKSNKRGLADHNCNCDVEDKLGTKWYYDWTLSPRNKCGGREFVPMIWGKTTHKGGPALPTDPKQVADMIGSGHKYLLGFNEPDNAAQSNLQPKEAAQLWKDIVEPVAKQLKLTTVSPAISSPGAHTWLSNFFQECEKLGCEPIKHVAYHQYSCDNSPYDTGLQTMKQWNKKIWLTEFSCPTWSKSEYTDANNRKVMDYTVPKLDSDSEVFRYSWYPNMPKGQLSTNFPKGTTLTDLGKAYAAEK